MTKAHPKKIKKSPDAGEGTRRGLGGGGRGYGGALAPPQPSQAQDKKVNSNTNEASGGESASRLICS